MAFAGLHVVCGYIGEGEHALHGHDDVFSSPTWSETLASAGTTTQAAPSGPGRAAFMLYAAADSWVVIGASALDASKSVSTQPSESRMFVKATTPTLVYANDGDKVAFIAVS